MGNKHTEMQRRSDRKNCKMFFFRLNRSTDEDCIKRLDEVGNKQGYIKGLMRADMERSKK